MNEEKIEKIYKALKRISSYQSPESLRRNSEKNYGLDYEEALEMAYENVIEEAKFAIKGIRFKSSLTP